MSCLIFNWKYRMCVCVNMSEKEARVSLPWSLDFLSSALIIPPTATDRICNVRECPFQSEIELWFIVKKKTRNETFSKYHKHV